MSAPRMVDSNAVRGGAAVSVVILLGGFVLGWRGVVPAIGVALGIGSAFGLRYSPLGATYRLIKKTLRLSIAVKPEEEPPPRFAQTLGFAFLALASAGFWVFNSDVLGWTLGLMVAGLQTLLAVSGICVGCEMYLFTKRLASKGA
ncbi:MAG: DUF4395 domain-containing protein [Actinomycetota bacterium]